MRNAGLGDRTRRTEPPPIRRFVPVIIPKLPFAAELVKLDGSGDRHFSFRPTLTTLQNDECTGDASNPVDPLARRK